MGTLSFVPKGGVCRLCLVQCFGQSWEGCTGGVLGQVSRVERSTSLCLCQHCWEPPSRLIVAQDTQLCKVLVISDSVLAMTAIKLIILSE